MSNKRNRRDSTINSDDEDNDVPQPGPSTSRDQPRSDFTGTVPPNNDLGSSIQVVNDFERLMNLFPTEHPSGVHGVLCMCDQDVNIAINILLFITEERKRIQRKTMKKQCRHGARKTEAKRYQRNKTNDTKSDRRRKVENPDDSTTTDEDNTDDFDDDNFVSSTPNYTITEPESPEIIVDIPNCLPPNYSSAYPNCTFTSGPSGVQIPKTKCETSTKSSSSLTTTEENFFVSDLSFTSSSLSKELFTSSPDCEIDIDALLSASSTTICSKSNSPIYDQNILKNPPINIFDSPEIDDPYFTGSEANASSCDDNASTSNEAKSPDPLFENRNFNKQTYIPMPLVKNSLKNQFSSNQERSLLKTSPFYPDSSNSPKPSTSNRNVVNQHGGQMNYPSTSAANTNEETFYRQPKTSTFCSGPCDSLNLNMGYVDIETNKDQTIKTKQRHTKKTPNNPTRKDGPLMKKVLLDIKKSGIGNCYNRSYNIPITKSCTVVSSTTTNHDDDNFLKISTKEKRVVPPPGTTRVARSSTAVSTTANQSTHHIVKITSDEVKVISPIKTTRVTKSLTAVNNTDTFTTNIPTDHFMKIGPEETKFIPQPRKLKFTKSSTAVNKIGTTLSTNRFDMNKSDETNTTFKHNDTTTSSYSLLKTPRKEDKIIIQPRTRKPRNNSTIIKTKDITIENFGSATRITRKSRATSLPKEIESAFFDAPVDTNENNNRNTRKNSSILENRLLMNDTVLLTPPLTDSQESVSGKDETLPVKNETEEDEDEDQLWHQTLDVANILGLDDEEFEQYIELVPFDEPILTPDIKSILKKVPPSERLAEIYKSNESQFLQLFDGLSD